MRSGEISCQKFSEDECYILGVQDSRFPKKNNDFCMPTNFSIFTGVLAVTSRDRLIKEKKSKDEL